MLFDLPTFTMVHVILSVAGIVAGLVVTGGFVAGVLFRRWTAAFLATTVLTNVTGFGFPFVQLLPSHMVGGLSLVVLAVALFALYGKHLAGHWRDVFAGTSVLALYLNVFVLLAQLLAKVPALAALAPAPNAPAFALTQLLFLATFAGLGWASVKGFRAERAAGDLKVAVKGAPAAR